MIDPSGTDNARFLFDMMARYLDNPDTDLVTPLQAYANSTDDPALTLVVLTAAAIINSAQTVLALADNNLGEAHARVRFAMVADAVDDVFIEPGTEQP